MHVELSKSRLKLHVVAAGNLVAVGTDRVVRKTGTDVALLISVVQVMATVDSRGHVVMAEDATVMISRLFQMDV